jgi:hypothetical protein
MDHTTNEEERHESSDYEAHTSPAVREERTESDYGRVGVSNDGMHRSQEAEDNCTSNLEPDAMVNINNESDNMGDAAALFVWMYLLLVSALLIGAVIIGCFVVVNYGFVVLIAVITAASALAVVAATLMSVITGDAKLTKARSTVDAWHVVVKDTILEEIDNLKEDISAFGNGTLLLTYEGPDESFIFEEDEDKLNGSDGNNQHKKNIAAERKPKSLLFKYVVSPFAKIGSKKQPKSSRKLFRKKKQQKTKEMSDQNGSSSSYLPPML